jgi:hypothetical protein
VAANCSATGLITGQRQPDGRLLRVIMIAWLPLGDKQRCRRLPFCGGHLTAKKPVVLWITQARYTQLHRPINKRQDGHLYYFRRQASSRAEPPPRVGGGSYWISLRRLAVAGAPRFARHAGGSDPASIAFDVHFEARRVVDKPIHSGERHGGVRKNARPFAKWIIGSNYQAAPFVTSSSQFEQDRDLSLIFRT